MIRSILGINVQYMKNKEIKVRTLAMSRMTEAHTGLYIAELVRKTLLKYGIPINQVVSITSDNGKNMLKAVKVFQLFQSHLIDDFLEANKDIELSSNKEAEKFINLQIQKLEHLVNDKKLVCGVHCAAHTTELAVHDAINSSPMENKVIGLARSLVKKLRTPSILTLIGKKKLRKPIIDCVTRWSSTFKMVSCYSLYLINFSHQIVMLFIHNFNIEFI